jgi:hypothetical protein
MGEGRHLGQKLGRHVLPGHEHVRGLEPRVEPGLEQVLPLDRKQPQLVPPAPLVQLAQELEPLVVARGDQAG